jgi:hypothetical protein
MTRARWPWGGGPAPALRCDECRRRLGKQATHFVIAGGEYLLCQACMTGSRGRSQRLHGKYYPECPESWHEMFDHEKSFATRAGAWFSLTDPEKRTA